MKTESEKIAFVLKHALTTYDRKQSTKKHYNPYALAQYLERAQEIADDVAAGADVRKAVLAGFNGRVADACLKALGLPKEMDSEARNGAVYYTPVAKQ